MEELRNMLDEEIKAELRDLSTLQSGSDEKTAAIENLARLHKLRIDEAKIELEHDEKVESNKLEDQFRRNQLAEQVKDRYLKLGVDVAGIILPLIFYAIWMRRGFRFEETGTYTSTTFRGLFNRFKPTK